MKLIRKYLTMNSRNTSVIPNDNIHTTTIETNSIEQINNRTDWLMHNEYMIGLMHTNLHILVSYSHQEREIAKYLVEQLEGNGYKVWVDYKDMMYETDVMEAMAKAVENSFVVCILYSKSYKESFNTKCEAEYAYHEKKPLLFLRVQTGYVPDGWLGFMMGTRLYIDISGKYPFEDKFIELCKRIDVYKQQPIEQDQTQFCNKSTETEITQKCKCFNG
ncbi:hypothetical protein MN116_007338 [Schistosoma mekongi]|uniref:TIR domain-containing protein n=1 Tax=Schistosoma mekongi TaxID=38744 RepID=A0AAE2D3D6_SCHME|nr:hypothetical protein MN116_007338 [Schistosoma mekongi]